MAVANSVEKAMLRWVARDPRVRFSLHLKVGVTARAEGGRGACGGFLFRREAPRGPRGLAVLVANLADGA